MSYSRVGAIVKFLLYGMSSFKRGIFVGGGAILSFLAPSVYYLLFAIFLELEMFLELVEGK